MRFVDDKNNSVRFNESFNVIKEKDSPIRNLGNAEKPTAFSYYPETVIKSNDLFQLKVNTKNVGTFIVAFIYKGLNREKLIEKVSDLKKVEVADKDSAKTKVEKLKDAVKEFNPIFIIFANPDVFAITIDEAKELFEGLNFFYVEKEGDSEVIEAECKEEMHEEVITEGVSEESEVVEVQDQQDGNTEIVEKVDETEEPIPAPAEVPVKEKPKKTNDDPFFKKCSRFLKKSGAIIKKDKFNFLFTLVAAILIGITIGIGVYKAYQGKYICIFFFIAALVGMALNSFVYRDVLVKHKFLSHHILLNALTSIVALAISIGIYYLFVYLTKEKANPAPKLILLMFIQLMSICASVGCSFLLKKFNRKK